MNIETGNTANLAGRRLGKLIPNPNPKLRFLDQCREGWRFQQMALRTEEAYVDWIRRFLVWAKDHPQLTQRPHPQPRAQPMGEGSVGLTPLAEGAEREQRWRQPDSEGAGGRFPRRGRDSGWARGNSV